MQYKSLALKLNIFLITCCRSLFVALILKKDFLSLFESTVLLILQQIDNPFNLLYVLLLQNLPAVHPHDCDLWTSDNAF